ncbi:MAG: hypothetical protein Q8J65_06375 [Nitrosomonadales bacterium]|nr:hypothetical protein [Nitrosomonadales bacterium]
MLYPDFPLIQQVKLISKIPKMNFAHEFIETSKHNGLIALEISQDELFMLARNEESLTVPTKVLRDALDDDLQLSPMKIRYMRLGNHLYEPNMQMRVAFHPSYADKVRSDFLNRKFKIIEDCKTISEYVIRTEMPLRSILGYAKIFQQITKSSGSCLSWLHNYTPFLDATI